jgi:pyruvate dehydrogenase E1 component alpha subunit
MPGASTDGNNLVEVKEAVQKAVDHARSGGGPSLIVNDTYRWRGHSKSDRNRYRTNDEIDEWKKKDPITRFRNYCKKEKLLTDQEAEQIKEQGYADIEEARVFAEASPEPKVETLLEGVYAP